LLAGVKTYLRLAFLIDGVQDFKMSRLASAKTIPCGRWLESKAYVAAFFALGLIASAGPAFGYSVKGVTLGDHVHFGSDAYKKYACSNSQAFYGNEFAGFTWCIKTEHESEKRGPFKASYTILHSDDGTIVYVNRHQEPAYWGDDEVQSDINYYSRRIGTAPTKIIKMPSRPGFPDGTIAIWGNVILERIADPESLKLLAVEKNPKLGVLIDFIGDYARSAKNDLPVYRIFGGPGFVWSASYNSHGKGTLRFLAIDPSAFYAHTIAVPKIPSPSAQKHFVSHNDSEMLLQIGNAIAGISALTARPDRNESGFPRHAGGASLRH
jgi:hypothetical protein